MASENIGTVSAALKVDSSGARAELKGFGDDLVKVGEYAKKAAADLGLSGDAAEAYAKKLARTMNSQRAAFQREAQQVTPLREIIRLQAERARVSEMAALRADIEARSVEKAGRAQMFYGEAIKAGRAAMGLIAPMGLGFGALEAVEGLKSMIEASMEAASQIGRLHEQTGIAINDLSVLKYAAKQTGTEFQTLTNGFKRLAVSVTDAKNGSEKAVEGFGQLGITVGDLRDRGDDMYSVLMLVADKFRSMPDGIEKSDTAAKIFGARMGSELIPLLNNGSAALQGFRDKAPIFSSEDIAKLEEMEHASKELGASWDQLKIKISSLAAPPLSWWFKEIASGDSVMTAFNKQVAALVVSYGQLAGLVRMPKLELRPPKPPGLPSSDTPGMPGYKPKPGKEEKEAASPTMSETERAYLTSGQHVTGAPILRDEFKAARADLAAVWSDLSEDFAAMEEQARAALQKFIEDSSPVNPSTTAMLQGQYKPVGLVPPATLFQKLSEAAAELTKQFTNTAELMSTTFVSGLYSFNSTVMQSLTMSPNQRRGQHLWGNMGAGFFNTAGNAALQYAEGSAMKLLGNAPGKLGEFFKGAQKPDGTQGRPLYVRSVDQAIGNKILSSPSGFADAGIGIVSKFLHFADGGPIPSNVPSIVGERGPELFMPKTAGTIIPNNRMGMGGGFVFAPNIDARGSNDPAATEAAVRRGIMQSTPYFQQVALATVRDHNRRGTSRSRL